MEIIAGHSFAALKLRSLVPFCCMLSVFFVCRREIAARGVSCVLDPGRLVTLQRDVERVTIDGALASARAAALRASSRSIAAA